MSRLHTSWFIARRLSASTDGASRGTMLRISIATTALSVAVMIISVAVVLGFKSEIANKVEGFVSRYRVVALSWSSPGEQPIERVPEIEHRLQAEPAISGVSVYASCNGVLKSDAAVGGVLLKGIAPDYNTDFFEQHLVEGSLPVVDSLRTKDILISSTLASELSVGVGDKVEFMFIDDSLPSRRDRYRVGGLYNTGVMMMDKRFVVTDLRNVQRLRGWGENQISGYEINTHTFEQTDALFEQLYRISVECEGEVPLMVLDTVEEYPTMFDWLKAHDVNAVVIITIMFVVSLLSALSALLIMLLERTRTIGILKALGMGNGAIQRIFLYRSLWVATLGVIIGDVLGVGLCLAQRHLHLIKLDSEGYFLSEMPVELNGWYILAINLGVVALLMVALTLPTLIISKIKPEKTIRYQ